MSQVSSAPLLAVHELHKSFGATLALRGVSFALQRGEVCAVLGENGAGKSTLMQILAGAYPCDSGRISLDGGAYLPQSPRDARKAGVALIHQELLLAEHLTVADNIVLGDEPQRGLFLDKREIRHRAIRALALMGHGEIDVTQRVSALSLPLRQVVEIARAVAGGSRIVIFDEPTSSLTAEDTARLFRLITALKTRGIGILYISHFLEEVERIADRVLVLRDGALVAQGAMNSFSRSGLVTAILGRESRDLFSRSPRTPGDTLLRIENPDGSRMLELRRGEIVGIGGLIGSGRSELLREIFGLLRRNGARISWRGFSGAGRPAERWATGMGFVSEDRAAEGLALNLSVATNMHLADRNAQVLALLKTKREASQTRHAIAQLAIRCSDAGQHVRDLSGGNQQKVALARLLLCNVDLFLLDEPTRGVDIGSKAEIYRLLDKMVSEQGKAVLIVSSYFPELVGLADRIAIMRRGELLPAEPYDKRPVHELMLEAVGGPPGVIDHEAPQGWSGA